MISLIPSIYQIKSRHLNWNLRQISVHGCWLKKPGRRRPPRSEKHHQIPNKELNAPPKQSPTNIVKNSNPKDLVRENSGEGSRFVALNLVENEDSLVQNEVN